MSTNKSACGESHRTIAKSTGIISLGTICSRLLGFIRDVVIARVFGVYALAQAFVIAFKIPNLFRDLLAEGAANAAFVPVFSGYKAKKSPEEFWELANVVLNLLLVVLMLLTIAGVFLSPLIVRLIAPGFIVEPEKLAVTIKLTRLLFPYILLASLFAYLTAILNSLKHFTAPAFAPCLLNISIISCVLIFKEGIWGLALGVLAGGILQLFIQAPILYKKGFRLNLFRRFRHPEAKTIGVLMAPRLFSSGIYQLNNFIDSIFGSLALIVGEGGVAVLYFAYRVIQFPLGIFSNALSQVILPAFSTQALEASRDNLRRTFSFGMRAVFFILLPAGIGFMVLSRQIISGLFGGGKFDVYSVQATADVLFFYSIGLFAFGANKILSSCFFGLKDTVTPAKVSLLSLLMNIALNSILMFPLKVGGLALATSISGIITFLIMFSLLEKKIGGIDIRGISRSFIKIFCASVAMGMVCYLASQFIIISSAAIFLKFVKLGLLISIGAASYIIFCFLFRVKEVRDLWEWVAGRKRI